MTETMIEDYTPEQAAQMDVLAEEWIKIGLSTEPADEPAVEQAITELYKQSGLARPEFVHFPSPEAALREFKTELTWEYGQHAAGWLAHYECYRRVFGLTDETQELVPFFAQARAGGWFAPYEKTCICVDRLATLVMDQSGLMHNPVGPACSTRDGILLYAWRGQVVPAEWIENKDGVDPSLALTHRSVELRGVLAEILGWDRVLSAVDCRVIDKDWDPRVGELIECEIGGVTERFLRGTCETGRQFALNVPPDTKTALDAQCIVNGVPEHLIRDMGVSS